MDRDTLKQFIEAGEGRRLACERDAEGVPRIGVGVSLQLPRNEKRIEVLGRVVGDLLAGREELTDPEVDWLLDGDVELALQDARAVVPNFDDLSDARQAVLVDMAFCLGRFRLASFKRMRAAIAAGEFEAAADEMIDSRWFRQVKTRGIRDVEIMRSGSLEGAMTPRSH